MMNKFQNKYRNESARLQSWNYGANAAYFITICTSGKEHYFGEILDSNQMELSEIGQHVQKCWSDIPSHFPFVILDAFIMMPDHIHGIIVINKQNINGDTVGTQNGAGTVGTQNGAGTVVRTQNFASQQQQTIKPSQWQFHNQKPSKPVQTKNKFGPQSQNLASIIRGFKIGITKYARINKIEFGWQARYHDHIIRNEIELERIRKYITTNPMNWRNARLQ
jgi:putative transposase